MLKINQFREYFEKLYETYEKYLILRNTSSYFEGSVTDQLTLPENF